MFGTLVSSLFLNLFAGVCRAMDLSEHVSKVVVEDPPGKWRLLGGPAKLNFPGFQEERSFPFLVAQVRERLSSVPVLGVVMDFIANRPLAYFY